jgi:hypothetical protein
MATSIALTRLSSLSLYLVMQLTGCAAASPPRADTPTCPSGQYSAPDNSPEARYRAALRDAAIPTSSEINNHLIALTREDTHQLVWESDAHDSRLKVVSLMSEETYQKHYAKPKDAPATVPGNWDVVIWVTAAPQLQEFCSRLTGDANSKIERLKEWLGLNPNSSYARVVEFWINPRDLARPCVDNEVTDTACRVDDGKPIADPDYAKWFTNNFRKSYQIGGNPWTRLGYTYDWATRERRSAEGHMGASEFIMRPGARYKIGEAFEVNNYCARRQ